MPINSHQAQKKVARSGRVELESKGRAMADKIVRTTLMLPEPLDKNIEVYCTKEGVSKNAAFLQLLSVALSAKGYQPSRTPKLTVSY